MINFLIKLPPQVLIKELLNYAIQYKKTGMGQVISLQVDRRYNEWLMILVDQILAVDEVW